MKEARAKDDKKKEGGEGRNKGRKEIERKENR